MKRASHLPEVVSRRFHCGECDVGDGEAMTGNRHNFEGNSGDRGESNPGPYWQRMHRDWRFWVGAVFMFVALAVYVLSGDLAFVPRHLPHSSVK
jgi:hypothetical protein